MNNKRRSRWARCMRFREKNENDEEKGKHERETNVVRLDSHHEISESALNYCRTRTERPLALSDEELQQGRYLDGFIKMRVK